MKVPKSCWLLLALVWIPIVSVAEEPAAADAEVKKVEALPPPPALPSPEKFEVQVLPPALPGAEAAPGTGTVQGLPPGLETTPSLPKDLLEGGRFNVQTLAPATAAPAAAPVATPAQAGVAAQTGGAMPPGLSAMMPAPDEAVPEPRLKPTKEVPETPPPDLAPPKYATLLEAAQAGDLGDVENHILRGDDLDQQDENGFTAVHWAAQTGQAEIIELLLDYGAHTSIMADKKEFSTPVLVAMKAQQWEAAALLRAYGALCSVHHAAGYGDVRGVRELVEEDVRALTEVSASRTTALHTAARLGQKETVEVLLDLGADPTALDIEGNTPFAMAAMNNHVEVVELMVAKGTNVDERLSQNETVLHRKARKGDMELIELLLSLGADINAKSLDGDTPLHVAVAECHQDMAKFLIDKGALMYAQNKMGFTPLHVAAIQGLPGMAGLLVDKGANVSRNDRSGAVPLHLAALNGRRQVAKLLLDRGTPVDVSDKRGQTPLHNVARAQVEKRPPAGIPRYLLNTEPPVTSEERIALIDLLLGRGANIEATSRYGTTPLHDAASSGRAPVASHLLDRGANIEARDNNGRSPLFFALEHDNGAVVRLLVSRGADIHLKDSSGQTPLHVAAQADHSDLVDLLIANGAQVNAVDHNSRAPLHAATKEGCVAIGQVLLCEGAKVNPRDIVGRTPLHLAAQRGDIRFLKLLIANQANIDAKDRNGRTAIHTAAWDGHWGPVQILAGDGADLNAADSHGVTALHIAAEAGHERMVRFLLGKGADASLKNSDGLTPLRLAMESENTEVINVLRPFTERQFERVLKAGDYARTSEFLDINPGLINQHLHGLAPLHIAAREGHKDLVELLLSKGANIFAAEDNETGMTPLHEAAQKGDKAMVELLLLMGANPSAVDEQGTTPVDRALGRGRKDIAETLRAAGGVTNKDIAERRQGKPRTKEEATNALAQLVHAMTHNNLVGAITHSDMPALEKIFAANPSLVDAKLFGAPPIYLAASLGKKDVVEFLLDNDANIAATAESPKGTTALHQAARHGFKDIVELLVARGADLYAKDKRDRTPLDLARLNDHFEIVAMLKQYLGIQ